MKLEKKKKGKGLRADCCENDNEIYYDKEENEFLFGHPSGVGGWTVIGEKDLITFMKLVGLIESEITLTTAIEILKEGLKDDDELAWGWHCNVAVQLLDEDIPHSLANKIATRIMRQLFEVDTESIFNERQMENKKDE